MGVVVVQLGVGNVASMMFALERAGARPLLTADPHAIAEADRLVLPGVGAAAFAMDRIEALKLTAVLKSFPRPFLGVCLGQQLLYTSSEEGDADCLGFIPGRVERMSAAPDRPVPHMGWNRLRVERDDPLLDGVDDGAYAYFVHSFACPVGEATLATSEYGGRFTAVVRRDNVWGCQFHPERSAQAGAKILANFLSVEC